MKSILAILFLFAGLLAPLSATAPSIALSSEYSWRVQIADLGYTNGSLTAVPVTVFYRQDVTSNGAVISNLPSTPPELTIDLLAKAQSTVTVNGTTYSYGQVFQLMQAIFTQERAAQIAALPSP